MKIQKRIWSLSERFKATAFLSVNKETILGANKCRGYNVIRKFRNYVNASKSSSQYKNYLVKIKRYHRNDLSKAIE
jgi:hypothetical protein